MKKRLWSTLGSALLLAWLAVAQTTNLDEAPAGFVSSLTVGTLHFTGGGSAVVSANLSACYFNGSNCGFTSGTVGYVLPDGTSATLRNFRGTMLALGGVAYEVTGTASGLNNEGHAVTVEDVEFSFTVSCRSGRGGGCTKTYTGGSMKLTE